MVILAMIALQFRNSEDAGSSPASFTTGYSSMVEHPIETGEARPWRSGGSKVKTQSTSSWLDGKFDAVRPPTSGEAGGFA